MEITDSEKMPLYHVFEMLKVECTPCNVPIIGSGFCGVALLKALIDISGYSLKVDNLTEGQVLEIATQNAVEKGDAFE